MKTELMKNISGVVGEYNKITVLTATLNAELYITRLIDSLLKQTDQDFEWLVIDGFSTDRTREFVEAAAGDLSLRCLVSKDFGIYDALNKGIQAIEGGYYLVVGADDILAPEAIKRYREAICEGYPDIITTAIRQGKKVVAPRQSFGWLYGLPGIASSHAVGMLLNVDLHQRFGLYSRKFPIAADQYFVKLALAGGATIQRRSFIAGEFSIEGTSGSDPIGLLTDVFRVQLLTERFVGLQILLFVLRIFKLYLFLIIGLNSLRPLDNSQKT